MKRMLLLVAAILALAVANAAEYVTLNVGGTGPSSRTVNLSPTDLVECIGMSGAVVIEITMADGTKTGFSDFPQATKHLYTGLTGLRFYAYNANQAGVLTLKITRGGDDENPAIPSNVAVIPNDADGQFEVILESSVDLVTWTPANPGTFGGDTPRRFFRTRIVKRN